MQIVYAFVNQDAVSLASIAGVNVLAAGALLSWLRFSGPQFYTPGLLPDGITVAKNSVVVLAVLFAVSPILQTLTESYIDETIWAQTILLSALHICFHSYRISSSESKQSPWVLLETCFFFWQ